LRHRHNRFRMGYNSGGRGKRHRLWAGKGRVSPSSLRRGLFQRWPEKRLMQDNVAGLNRGARGKEAYLRYLGVRIGKVDQGYASLRFVAIVDAEKCVGCGVCLDTCPNGAVFLDEVARIDRNRCIGCGRCVETCPQGAVSLRPAEPYFQEQTESAL